MRDVNSGEESNPLISIIIPCHNSTKFLRETFALLAEKAKGKSYELIFVENGSTDFTFVTLQELLKKCPDLRNAVVVQSQKGLGFALRKGIELSQGRFIVYTPDDMPLSLQELKYIEENLKLTSEIVFFSKYITPFSYGRPFLRVVVGLAFSFVRERILNVGIRDTQSSFAGLGAELRNIASKTLSTDYTVTAEIAYLAKKNGVEVKEVPIESIIERRDKTTVRPSDSLRMLLRIIEIRRQKGDSRK